MVGGAERRAHQFGDDTVLVEAVPHRGPDLAQVSDDGDDPRFYL
jgi:hypothetical protein